jgi:hypothetical protein
MDVTELRKSDRFVAVDPLPGTFGTTSVIIVDLAAHGAQIEHAQPLRLGSTGKLAFRLGDINVLIAGITIWSHLSKAPNARGKYLYRSGVRIDAAGDDLSEVVTQLAGGGFLKLDDQSMQRKKLRAEAKRLARAREPHMKVLPPDHDIPPDQILLIEHARTRLRSDPEEARRWYNRARFALNEEHSRGIAESIRHREDVLAVWEYLERTIDINMIVRVFEKHTR